MKIVLAYSGGLDTSVAIRWLQEERGFDVVVLGAAACSSGKKIGDSGATTPTNAARLMSGKKAALASWMREAAASARRISAFLSNAA